MIEVVAVYWIKILATLVVFAALMAMFLRREGDASGPSGAEAVQGELDRLGDEYAVVPNVIVPSERGMSCIPYVVVSPYGVFVVSLCDRAGKISGHVNDREWQVKSRRERDTVLNPLWENRRHVNALEKKVGPRSWISVVVVTRARLLDDFGPNVVRTHQLRQFLAGYTRAAMNQDEQNAVIDALKAP